MKFIVLVVISVLFGSCFNDGNCLITATNYMHIQFKKESNIKLDTVVDLTTIYISGTDSILAVNAATKEVLIPLDIHSATTTFILQHTNPSNPSLPAADTFHVQYTAQSKIIAKDCGAFTYYQNLKVLYTSLKESQIKVVSTSLLKDPTQGNIPSAYAVNYQILY
jgi:hypothetical protein